jgi:hypothetical protein
MTLVLMCGQGLTLELVYSLNVRLATEPLRTLGIRLELRRRLATSLELWSSLRIKRLELCTNKGLS